MNYIFPSDSIPLKSSFRIKKDDFDREFLAMREEYPECMVWNTSIKSLKKEWAAHNAFHAMGVFRKETADVDLNWLQGWLTRVRGLDCGMGGLAFIRLGSLSL